MKIAEAEKQFGISAGTIKKYVSRGFIEAKPNYEESDFDNFGLVSTLLMIGLSDDEIRRYLSLRENNGLSEERICMLKKYRRTLLNNIRSSQQLLDKLDFLIYENKKGL